MNDKQHKDGDTLPAGISYIDTNKGAVITNFGIVVQFDGKGTAKIWTPPKYRKCMQGKILRSALVPLIHQQEKHLHIFCITRIFSRGGNFRYIREFGFCATISSSEINIHCEWNFAKFSSREFFLHAKKIGPTNSGLSPLPCKKNSTVSIHSKNRLVETTKKFVKFNQCGW